jgi:hypothetical protein
MAKWSKSAFSVPRPALMEPMQFRVERFRCEATRVAHLAAESPDGNAGGTGFRAAPKNNRDNTSPSVGVMLHLR